MKEEKKENLLLCWASLGFRQIMLSNFSKDSSEFWLLTVGPVSGLWVSIICTTDLDSIPLRIIAADGTPTSKFTRIYFSSHYSHRYVYGHH